MSHLDKVGSGGYSAAGPETADTTEAKVECLLRCEIFGALPADAIERVARRCSVVRYRRRRGLYRHGQKARHIFVIVSGRVRVLRRIARDRALTVGYRGPGELLGETALVDQKVYQEVAAAAEDTEAICVPVQRIERLLELHPSFSSQLLRLMVARRVDAEKRIDSLLSRSVESRLLSFLLEAATRHGIPSEGGVLISVRFTHQEIADYIGSTRETVTVTLGELRRRKLLRSDHRRLVVADMDRLMELSVL